MHHILISHVVFSTFSMQVRPGMSLSIVLDKLLYHYLHLLLESDMHILAKEKFRGGALWNFRNSMCFQGIRRTRMKAIRTELIKLLVRWRPLCKSTSLLDRGIRKLERKRGELLRIAWT